MDTLQKSEKERISEAKQMLALSLEGFKRGRMFISPLILGVSNDEWISAAKAKIRGIDKQTDKV